MEKRNEQREKVKAITEKLDEEIRQFFESERYKEYLKVMSKFYHYSVNNCFLIMMQNPDATHIASFTSWQNHFKRQVRKGEKGIQILQPAPYRIKKEVDKTDKKTGAVIHGEKEMIEVIIPAFKVAHVFDITQTEGKELPQLVNLLTEKADHFYEYLDAIIRASPVPVRYEHIAGGANGYYHPINKEIVIEKNLYDNKNLQCIKTAVHELAHSLVDTKPDGLGRNEKEVRAESIAYVVCNYLGLDTSDYSFGYIAGWAKDKEVKELKENMNIIRNTANEIIEKFEEKIKKIEPEMKYEKTEIKKEKLKQENERKTFKHR